MPGIAIGRPGSGEHLPYYGQYIALVPDGDILELLERQVADTVAFCASLSSAQARQRRAPEEWNATEIVGHLADVERVCAYRALRIARADPTPLNGVEFDDYVTAGGFAERPLGAVVAEFVATRQATMGLLRGLDAAAWARVGTADGSAIGVRALAYIIAGHELHHLADLHRWFDGEERR